MSTFHALFVLVIGTLYIVYDMWLLHEFSGTAESMRRNWRGGLFADAGRSSRGDLLQSLDDELTSGPHYLMLQRMGLIAPLLGVLITVFELLVMNIDAGTSGDPLALLRTIKPLGLGVGLGALLAIVHQAVFLQRAHRTVSSVRQSAEGELAKRPDDPIERALAQFGAKLQGFTQELEERISRISLRTDKGITALDAGFATMTRSVQGVAERCEKSGESLHHAATTFGTGLSTALTTIGGGVTTAGEAVAASGRSVQEQLGEWRTSLGQASREISLSVANFTTAVTGLHTLLREAANEREVIVEMHRTLQNQAGTTVSELVALAAQLKQEVAPAMKDAASGVREASDAAARANEQLTSIGRSLVAGVEEASRTYAVQAGTAVSELVAFATQLKQEVAPAMKGAADGVREASDAAAQSNEHANQMHAELMTRIEKLIAANFAVRQPAPQATTIPIRREVGHSGSDRAPVSPPHPAGPDGRSRIAAPDGRPLPAATNKVITTPPPARPGKVKRLLSGMRLFSRRSSGDGRLQDE